VDTGPIAATGHQITTLALAVAVLAPVLLPTVSGGLFGIGPNSGDGPGSGHKGKAGVFSQKLDLRANLGSDSDEEVLTYKSTKPVYLRFQTADLFDAKALGESFVPDPNPPMLPIGPDDVIAAAVPGYAGTPQPKTIKVDIDVQGGVATEDHKGAPNALPLPYPAQSLSKPVDGFKVNANSLALLGPGQVAKGSHYSATVYDVSPDALPAAVLHNAKLPTAQDIGRYDLGKDLDVKGVPKQVTDLAAELTKDVPNPIDAALKIQNYFQVKEDGFKYNLRDVPTDMNGAEAMLYLLRTKQGYCQLYAETMVAMARSLGIPARVALGFTPGSSKGDGVYRVRLHDYHSWPELFFDGVGWLRFEPTVGIDDITRSPGHGRVPQYDTVVASSGATAPTTTSSSSAGAPAGATQSDGCPANVRRAGECNDTAGNGAVTAKAKFSWLGWFGAVPRFLQYWLFGGSGYAIALRFILLALLLLACVPMVLRIARRRARSKLASGRGRGGAGSGADPGSGSGPGSGSEDGEELDWRSADVPSTRRPESDPERLRILAAWAELRDSATDLGYTWPVSETPRQSAQRIVKQAHLSRSAQDAMNRVTGLAERANYARTLRRPSPSGAAPMPNLMEDVKVIRAGLAEPVSRRTRLRATVLPPSSLAALRERREDLTGRVYERLQGTGVRLRSRVPGGRAGVRPPGTEGRGGRDGVKA
jgi:transglutaminase-like putative cysteine protease